MGTRPVAGSPPGRVGPDVEGARAVAYAGVALISFDGAQHRSDIAAGSLPGVHVVQAGTALVDGALVTAGGRVLAVVGTGPDVEAARTAAYAGVSLISFDGAQHRTDIADAGQWGP